MVTHALLLTILLPVLLSCNGFKSSSPTRSIASTVTYENNMLEDLDNKLLQIHIYKIIAQNQMLISTEETGSADNVKPSSFRFQAATIQARKVEQQILSLLNNLKLHHEEQAANIRINQIAEKSLIHAYTLEGIRSKLNLTRSGQILTPTKVEIENEIRYLSSSTQYQVFLQNVEHLSFMLETRVVKNTKHIYTSSLKIR